MHCYDWVPTMWKINFRYYHDWKQWKHYNNEFWKGMVFPMMFHMMPWEGQFLAVMLIWYADLLFPTLLQGTSLLKKTSKYVCSCKMKWFTTILW